MLPLFLLKCKFLLVKIQKIFFSFFSNHGGITNASMLYPSLFIVLFHNLIKILWLVENHPKIDISEKKINEEKLMIQHFYMGSLLIIHEYNPKQEIVR